VAIDDEIQQKLQQLAESSGVSVQVILRNATVVAGVAFAASQSESLLQSMGLLGTAILAAMGEVGKGRFRERLLELLAALKQRMDEVGEQKIDRDYIFGEEFQSVLFDALDQLKTSHDRTKIQLLASALASCAAIEFSLEQRKELFVRLVRDLTAFHIHQLVELSKEKPQIKSFPPEMRWAYRPRVKGPDGECLMVLQQLAGEGLVEETIEGPKPPHARPISSQSDAARFLAELLEELSKPPVRCFRLSELGRDFINFVALKQE